MTPPKMATDRYNAAEAEARWQRLWEERGIFAGRGQPIAVIEVFSRNKFMVPAP
jgi:valyl-tRNA synthetase